MTNKYHIMALGWTLIVLMSIPGCRGNSGNNETTTRGHLIVVASESIKPVLDQEKEEFERLYLESKIDIEYTTDRDAITRLFNDTIKAIVIDRRINKEEEKVAEQYKLSFKEYVIAGGAVAVIVNAENPVSELRTTQLDSIFSGSVKEWKNVGGKGKKIDLCLPDRNLATFETVGKLVLGGKEYAQPVKVAASPAEVIKFVSENQNSIGFVSVNILRENMNKIKVLALSDPNAPDSLQIRGQYFTPLQAHIHRKYYPLTNEVCIYSKADMYSLAAGFISFITSAPGQKIVLNNGLVPATMPVRLVQLTNRGI